ncbi:hypothetical protein [Candidatus Enterococcus ferrettii]|uniref:Uncharacterized protein n=1 Tax=Candidatus Enterococcus ferrettii TaxID=2815324 RepID=A0ABV0EIA1_9ENTE|nr:hypothetical protein [Enterococcus sp. 665A]MBO1341860.1 hypothetical protein [Enterococcus sp. 665A]
MSYVVKMMCYLDEYGNGMPSLKHAKKHENKEMAELVAETCGGRVVELIDQKDAVKVRTKMHPKTAPTKPNQSWMRKGC